LFLFLLSSYNWKKKSFSMISKVVVISSARKLRVESHHISVLWFFVSHLLYSFIFGMVCIICWWNYSSPKPKEWNKTFSYLRPKTSKKQMVKREEFFNILTRI
jgi:hypothetical protein